MKKILLGVFFTLVVMSCYAQSTHNNSGTNLYHPQFFKKPISNSDKSAAKRKLAQVWADSIPISHIIMANGAYSTCPEYGFGLTYGMVHVGGWYVNMMYNPSVKYSSEYVAVADGLVWNPEISGFDMPFYNGKRKSTRTSVTVGGLARLYIPLYFYGGLGYGYRAVFYETKDGKWARFKSPLSPGHGVHWELGLIGNIKGFAISAGASGISNSFTSFYEATIGVGCFINQRK